MELSVQSIKTSTKKAYNALRNSDFANNIKSIKKEIREINESGKVFNTGVTDNAVLEQLAPASKGLEDYAKANNINIIFHTPQKPIEAGSNQFEKPLTITAYKKGALNSYMASRTIDGDVDKITKAKVELPSRGKKIVADIEDSFLRRVYRNVSDITQEINEERHSNSIVNKYFDMR